MRRLVPFLIWCVFLTSGAQAEVWSAYLNDNYGFGLSYPSETFALERQSDAGDGVLFKTRDNDAKLLIGVLPNVDHHNPSTYQDLIARKSYGEFRVDYKKRGKTWLVLSGENDTTVFYEKVHFACGATRIVSFAVLYPRAQKDVFDPIVERMEDSFQASSKGCRPEAASAETRVEPSRREKSLSRPSTKKFGPSKRARGSYAALANRIARSRGRNVVVILRRTGPPYDYKVVRGYR